MRGFTLLEVMVSLAICAGVLLTLISVFNRHLDLVTRDRQETVALLLAREKLAAPTQAASSEIPQEGTFAPTWPDYAWRSVTLPTDIPGLARTVFTVTWQAGKRELALVRYAAR